MTKMKVNPVQMLAELMEEFRDNQQHLLELLVLNKKEIINKDTTAITEDDDIIELASEPIDPEVTMIKIDVNSILNISDNKDTNAVSADVDITEKASEPIESEVTVTINDANKDMTASDTSNDANRIINYSDNKKTTTTTTENATKHQQYKTRSEKRKEIELTNDHETYNSINEDDVTTKTEKRIKRKTISKAKTRKNVTSIFNSIFAQAHQMVLMESYQITKRASTSTKDQQKSNIESFFNEHVSVTQVTQQTKIKLIHSQGLAIPTNLIYYINLRNNDNKYENYVSIQKSTLGMDSNGKIIDRELYNKSGFGLFANRVFNKDECIGVYLGRVSKKQPESYYSYEWNHCGDVYYVDPGGGLGHPLYFGTHMVNHSRTLENVYVEDDLYFYAKRSISKGEELFIDYGQNYGL